MFVLIKLTEGVGVTTAEPRSKVPGTGGREGGSLPMILLLREEPLEGKHSLQTRFYHSKICGLGFSHHCSKSAM